MGTICTKGDIHLLLFVSPLLQTYIGCTVYLPFKPSAHQAVLAILPSVGAAVLITILSCLTRCKLASPQVRSIQALSFACCTLLSFFANPMLISCTLYLHKNSQTCSCKTINLIVNMEVVMLNTSNIVQAQHAVD